MINVITGDEHDHGHNHDEPAVEPAIAEETGVVLESPAVDSHEGHGHEGHSHEGLDGLWEVMFGFEHVMAEFFWNAVFIVATYFVTKGIALRKAHKYIDGKHGVTHDKKDY